MKKPFDNDPLLRAIIEEEEPISLTAAADVRRRVQKRRKILRSTILAAMVLVGGVVTFSLWDRFTGQPKTNYNSISSTDRNTSTTTVTETSNPTRVGAPPPKTASVKEYSADSQIIAEDYLTVVGAATTTEQEQTLLKDLNGQPVLIVWNDAGHVSRVHIFGRTP